MRDLPFGTLWTTETAELALLWRSPRPAATRFACATERQREPSPRSISRSCSRDSTARWAACRSWRSLVGRRSPSRVADVALVRIGRPDHPTLTIDRGGDGSVDELPAPFFSFDAGVAPVRRRGGDSERRGRSRWARRGSPFESRGTRRVADARLARALPDSGSDLQRRDPNSPNRPRFSAADGCEWSSTIPWILDQPSRLTVAYSSQSAR